MNSHNARACPATSAIAGHRPSHFQSYQGSALARRENSPPPGRLVTSSARQQTLPRNSSVSWLARGSVQPDKLLDLPTQRLVDCAVALGAEVRTKNKMNSQSPQAAARK